MSAALAYAQDVRPQLVRELRERIDLLKEENRQLREALKIAFTFPAAWRLTRLDARLLKALMRAGTGLVTFERLLTILYGTDSEADADNVRMAVCLLRRRLSAAASGVEIRNVWGTGYCLTDLGYAHLREAVAATDTPEAIRRGKREAIA